MINKKKDVIELESKLNSIEAELKSNDALKFNQRITELWQYIKEREADEKLKNMPIDTISSIEKGLPVNQLINAGYQTVYDVSRFTVNQFLSVKGIGDKSAHPLKSSVEKIKQSVHLGTAGRINPDDLTRLDYDALEAIYLKHHILIENEHILKDIQNFRADFQKDFDSVKEQGNFIVSLFQSKEKKDKIQQSIQSLNDRNVTGRFKDIEDAYLKVINFKVDEQTLKADFIANNIKYYSEIESLTGQTNKKDAEDIPSELVEAVNAVELNTEGLDLTLRHYQAFGAKYMLYSKRVLLGDEMGLGKTVQALAVLNHLNHDGKQAFIVVCPLSVVANWKRETEKFTKLNALIYHGKDRDQVFKQWQEEKGILITTFSHTRNIDKNAVDHIDALIVDEAHYIKNPEAKRSISVYELAEKAEYVSFMSGTPMENRLEEMKQLISVLQENIADKISNELHLLEPKKFKREVAAVYLRRNRADVLGELPELEIIEQWSDFGQEEQVLYDQAVENGKVMTMRRAAWQGGSPDKSPKLDALREICEAARENGHKVLVFSFFRDVIETIQEHLTGQTFPAITGDVPNSDRQKIVDDFTSAEPGAVMVSQITAGGVGLNIQAANIIVLCEPQWKPSTEEQAISRAYRMGQSRNVMVYRLLTQDSIDGSMLEVLAEKSQLFNDYARESEVANIAQETEEISEASLTQKVLEMEKERLTAKEAVS